MDTINNMRGRIAAAIVAVMLLSSVRAMSDCVCPDPSLTLEGPSIVCLGESIAPTNIIKYCGSLEKYPGRYANGTCKPCQDCSDGCEVDLIVPEVTGPGVYSVQGTLISACGTALDGYTVNVGAAEEWPDWKLGGSIEIPNGAFDSLNNVLKPAGIEFSLELAAEIEYRERLCCSSTPAASVKEQEYEGTIFAKLKGSKAWGPKYEVKAGSDLCSVSFKAWATVEVSADASAEASVKRVVLCDESDVTSFSAEVSTTLAAEASAGFETCKSVCHVQYCTDSSITLAKISATTSAGVVYENGVKSATAQLDCVELSAEINVGPFNYEWKKPLAGLCSES